MHDEFYIEHLDRNGVVKNKVIDDFLWMTYTNRVNGAGRLDFVVNHNHRIVDDLAKFDLFIVHRRNLTIGIPWHVDFMAVFRDQVTDTDDNLNTLVTIKAPGDFSILGYRYIFWPAGVNNRTEFTNVAGETVGKTLVDYNCTSLATVANGRHRDGDLAPGMGFTINTLTDQGRGDVMSRAFSNKKLDDVLREKVAPVAGGDFDLIYQGSAVWDFEFFPGQLGDDKTSGPDRVEFSLARRNIREPVLRERRIEEATVAVAGGKNEGADRELETVQGPDYAADNDIEIFVDARSHKTAAGLISAAASDLADSRAVTEFGFEILQTPHTLYSTAPVSGRKTYKVGDLVRIKYFGVDVARKVTAVTVEHRPSDSSPETSISVLTGAA